VKKNRVQIEAMEARSVDIVPTGEECDQHHRERAYRRRIAEGHAPAKMAADHRAEGNAEHQRDRESANHDREGTATLFGWHQRGDRNGRKLPGECSYDTTKNS
jgi:hypothetical protein